jgi:hypothetical protein
VLAGEAVHHRGESSVIFASGAVEATGNPSWRCT